MPADGLVKLKATAVAAVAPATAEAAMNQPDNTSRPRPETAVTMASSRPNAIFRRSGSAKRRMGGRGLSDPDIKRPPPGRRPGPPGPSAGRPPGRQNGGGTPGGGERRKRAWRGE